MTSSQSDGVTWLTQEAHDRLSRELQDMINNRPAMAKEINDRREEGDLKENGGYHAAREEQRERLDVGVALHGPAILDQFDCTTVVWPRQIARIDQWKNVIITEGAR